MRPVERIRELVAAINRHNHLYYVVGRTEISDREYDRLLAELTELEAAHPELVLPDSPTQRVGSDAVDGFEKITHPVPMLSIQNGYSREDLYRFDERIRRETGRDAVAYVCEAKIDGVSLTLMYEKGELKYGATRGDGTVGDAITPNVRTIREIPLKLDGKPPLRLEVRGEVYFSARAFERINRDRAAAGEELFANPRNAAAGTLKLLDSKTVARRGLSFFAYTVGAAEGFSPSTQAEIVKSLAAFGFRTLPSTTYCRNMDEVWARIAAFDVERKTLDYGVDGMVVKVDDLGLQRSLGRTAKAPKWVFAYKYEAERAETPVLGVTVQVGRLGTCTPVAELRPVPLAGTVVKRATLHNADEIERLGLCVGDTVVIEKAGEIIPKVLSVRKDLRDAHARKFEFPDKCPDCATPLIREDVYYRCPNTEFCPAQVKGRIVGYASRGGMDIDGLGPAVVEQLYDRGLVREFTDIYNLEYEQLVELEKMADKSAHNLLRAITESKKRPLSRLIFSLGIPNVGARLGEILADAFGSLDALKGASAEELEAVEDVGPVVAQSIASFFASTRGGRIVDELKRHGVNTVSEKREKIAAPGFAGKTFVLTGTLTRLSRGAAEKIIRDLGGKTSSAVSKKTDYVLVGENPGSKAEKAEKLGVVILDEDGFDEMVRTAEAAGASAKPAQRELF